MKKTFKCVSKSFLANNTAQVVLHELVPNADNTANEIKTVSVLTFKDPKEADWFPHMGTVTVTLEKES